jgi:Amt family ammonium transporter
VHGVGGFLGIVLCGVFATTLFNPAGTDGLLRGNSHFFLVQLGAVLLSSVWAFVFTYGMLWIIDRITKVKVDEAGETEGLDMAIHGEAAYLEGI